MEVADAQSPLSPESQNPIPEMNVQIHTIFFQFRNIMFENIKVQSSVDAELSALEEIMMLAYAHPTSPSMLEAFQDTLSTEDEIVL